MIRSICCSLVLFLMIPMRTFPEQAQEPNIPVEEIAALEAEVNNEGISLQDSLVDLDQVFAGSPGIYSLLILLSIGSVALTTHLLFSMRREEFFPAKTVQELKDKASTKDRLAILSLCATKKNLLSKILAKSLSLEPLDQKKILSLASEEGKRLTASFWQKISLLSDVAVLAPMLGLLGTVLGMFYAFYDLNRSSESISTLFDGLGISVGTTVAGLIVALVAMTCYSLVRYRLLSQLRKVEETATLLIEQSSTSLLPPSSTTQSEELSRNSIGNPLMEQCTSSKESSS